MPLEHHLRSFELLTVHTFLKSDFISSSSRRELYHMWCLLSWIAKNCKPHQIRELGQKQHGVISPHLTAFIQYNVHNDGPQIWKPSKCSL